MDIYLDVLVLVNTYITWLLLSLTATLSHTRSNTLNRAIASFIGGASALIILIPTDVKLLAFTVFLLKVISCVTIVTVSFWRQSVRKTLALSAAFFGCNMLMSAALDLLQRFLGTRYIAISSGFIYLDISPLNLMFSTAVIYLAVCWTTKLFERRLGMNNSYRVDFKLGCKAFSLDAIADTGNNARDLFSGLPVIICTGVAIENGTKVRAVPYKTVSGEGVLYAYSPDALIVTDEKGNSHEVSALVAGIEGGEQRAIFNPRILSQ